MWTFLKKTLTQIVSFPNEEHIEACIGADPWMLYCAAGCENGTLGYPIPWDSWWSMAKFGADALSRYRTMFPDDPKPLISDIERITRRMVAGKYSEDFISNGSLIGPGETRTLSLKG